MNGQQSLALSKDAKRLRAHGHSQTAFVALDGSLKQLFSQFDVALGRSQYSSRHCFAMLQCSAFSFVVETQIVEVLAFRGYLSSLAPPRSASPSMSMIRYVRGVQYSFTLPQTSSALLHAVLTFDMYSYSLYIAGY